MTYYQTKMFAFLLLTMMFWYCSVFVKHRTMPEQFPTAKMQKSLKLKCIWRNHNYN